MKSVRAKLREGLFKMKFAGLMESHSDETHIEKMENGMLRSAGV